MATLPPEDQISQESPPSDATPELSEWLTRTIVNINGALKATRDLVPTSIPPEGTYNGHMQYFQAPLPTDILYEGPWMIVDGQWRPLIGMYHRGRYSPGTQYWPQDVVIDAPWVMACIRKTLDAPGPVESGPAEALLPDVPVFATSQNVSLIESGVSIVFSEGGWINLLQAWVPEISPTTTYEFVIIDNTDPDDIRISSIKSSTLVADAWSTLKVGQEIVVLGTSLIIYIRALNVGGSTPFGPFGWRRGINSQAGAPLTSEFNVDNQLSILRIDKTDLDTVDRSAQLLGIIAGSTITIALTSNPSIYAKFNVNANPIDSGTDIEFLDVVLADAAGSLDIGAVTSITASIPVQQSTQYSEILNHWVTEPTWASAQGFLRYDGVAQAGNEDTAFGIRFEFTPGDVSEDWVLVSNND